MSPSDFGEALLGEGSKGAGPDPRDTAARAIARDRRRVRVLATLTILFWFLYLVFAPSLLLPLMAKLRHNIDPQAGILANDPPVSSQMLVGMTVKVITMLLAASTLTSLAAAICMVMLILTVRRLT